MTALTAPLREHHTHCDDLFVVAETSVAEGDWEGAARSLEDFVAALEAHFQTEESVLFPAFENATGTSGGPTQVMRLEHAQMRDLCEQMRAALGVRAVEDFTGAAQTLLIHMQQHNMKEENILYPMCDQALGASEELAGKLSSGLLGA